MDTTRLLAEVETLVTPILDHLGFELIERELVSGPGGWVLRFYIDREGGAVGIDDCHTVSKAIEAVLDVEDCIPHRYTLEVSSPGLDRPLRRPKDFQRFIGEKVDIRTKETIAGRSHFIGILKGMAEKEIIIQEQTEEWRIPLEILKKAHVKYDFSKGG